MIYFLFYIFSMILAYMDIVEDHYNGKHFQYALIQPWIMHSEKAVGPPVYTRMAKCRYCYDQTGIDYYVHKMRFIDHLRKKHEMNLPESDEDPNWRWFYADVDKLNRWRISLTVIDDGGVTWKKVRDHIHLKTLLMSYQF